MKRMLAVFDIDGTLRTEPDPWLHLHRHLGTIDHGEEVFRRWSAGEITYLEMATLESSVWKGVDRRLIIQSLESNPIRSGARKLVEWFKVRQIPCVGISTGLSVFNDVTSEELGLDEVISNDLLFDGDVCTGSVSINVEEDGKADVLRSMSQRYECNSTIVFGDGAADVALFQTARVSVAVFPRHAHVSDEAHLVVDTEPIHEICDDIERMLNDA